MISGREPRPRHRPGRGRPRSAATAARPVHVHGGAGELRPAGHLGADRRADRRAPAQVVLPPARRAGVGAPGPVAPGQPGQDRFQQRLAAGAGGARQPQRGGRRHRQLGRAGRHVESHSDHDRITVCLGQDPGQLPLAGQHIVRPLQDGRHGRLGAQRGRHGHAGEQRQPAPQRGLDRGRPEQHREGQGGPRRAHPRPAQPAPPGGLRLGRQHQPFRRPGPGRGEQVSVGGAGLGHHQDLPPQPAGADHAAAQAGRVQRRPFHLGLLGHAPMIPARPPQ